MGGRGGEEEEERDTRSEEARWKKGGQRERGYEIKETELVALANATH